jgi:alpha-tubulin suppressor-like RCC1 family protein
VLLTIIAQACERDLPAGPHGSSSAGLAASSVAPRLAFVTELPASGEANVVISPPVRVAVQDSLGNTVPGAADTVTLALAANPSEAVLLGTTTVAAIDGIATFADLRVDRPGSRYTLAAAAVGLQDATSATFAERVAFTSVDGGYVHTCGVTTSGAAYCWGDNYSGQLGEETASPAWYRASPAPVAGRDLKFTTLSTGVWHTCGVTASGAAYCWGDNFFGQLGDGTNVARATPVPVAGALRFAAVSAGSFHTCGVTTSGAAYCWGDNRNAQLGDGTTDRRATPVPIAGGLAFTTISAGHGHTCGVIPRGVAVCWGDDSSGQLGDGTATADHGLYRPYPARVVGVRGFASVSAGNVHTCGVTTRGAAYCWGYNVWGQLGDGTTAQRASPVRVTGRLRFAVVDAGSYFSCGVTTGGAAYCWGENRDGELGDGTTTSRSSPVAVAGGLRFAAVRAGWYHVCGMKTDSGAYCWGYNAHGQLGEGTTIAGLTPTLVVQ